MKRKLLFTSCLLLFAALAISSCSKDDGPNIFKGTNWQTRDMIAEVFYGGTCYEVIHFIDNKRFEVYSTRNGTVRTYDHEGTYTYNNKTKIVKLVHTDNGCEKVDEELILVNNGTLKRSIDASDSWPYNTYVKQ